MFFSVNDEKFSENNRELAEFILDPSSQDLSNRYRVFNYINTEGQLRNIPLMASGSLITGNFVLETELAFPPLGHVLTIDFSGRLPYRQEITSFKNNGLDELTTVDFKIFRLPTHLPLRRLTTAHGKKLGTLNSKTSLTHNINCPHLWMQPT